MLNFKRKREWIASLNAGKIDRNEKVTLWVLPAGALCELGYIENVPYLRNGVYNGLGVRIAELMLSVGIHGRVIINNENQLPQSVPNWLTWWLSQVDYEKQLTLYGLKLTTFGIKPTGALPFQVETIFPMEVEAGAVLSVISAKSKSPAVSQFLIERKNGDSYRLEPHRTVNARVIDVTEYGFVLRADSGAVFATHQVHHSLRADLQRNNLKPEDLIGTDVTVHYTMFTQGNRLNNYKSAQISRSAALGENDDHDGQGFTFDRDTPLFQAPAWAQCTGMLKLQHCTNAVITINEEASIITAHDSTDPTRQLFRFVKGAKAGHFVASLVTTDGQPEAWTFLPDAGADTINPERFVQVMESVLYYATGLSIRELGLCYTDRMKQLDTA